MSKLTDMQIRGWIKTNERFDLRGDGNGLYLRYRAEDRVPLWRYRYRFAGKQRVMNLGSYADISLANARKTVKQLAAMVALGRDVAAEKQERKREALAKMEREKQARTMAQLADEYFERNILGRWKHPNIVRSRINNDIKPNIGRLAVEDVKPSHIEAMLQKIVKRGAPTMANDVLRWTRRMFDFAIKRHMVTVNPAAAFDIADAGGKEESRDRALSRDELVRLFAAMRDAKGWIVQNTLAVKLLLMLAVRKGELIGARVNEFNLGAAVWNLPAERTKTNTPLDIPLPPAAVGYVRELIGMAEGSDYLLPARKLQSRMIPHIDTNTINAAMAKMLRPLLKDLESFSPHDFRRTARTHLAELGVAAHVAERCLNHKLKGVEGIYNRYDYFDERKAALNAWANLLAQLEKGDAEKVIPIRSKATA